MNKLDRHHNTNSYDWRTTATVIKKEGNEYNEICFRKSKHIHLTKMEQNNLSMVKLTYKLGKLIDRPIPLANPFSQTLSQVSRFKRLIHLALAPLTEGSSPLHES